MATPTVEELPYIPISKRPEWSDITPLLPPPIFKNHPHTSKPSTHTEIDNTHAKQQQQQQQEERVVYIKTDSDHQDLLSYFWAVNESSELSHRLLDLTEEIITQINSAHYSVWTKRWLCIEALGGLELHQEKEEALLRHIATENPKNYQLWNYRRVYALARGAEHAADELHFSTACLSYDAKNYHAWAHRQAIILSFQLEWMWSEEFGFVERMLQDDLRNNSAWNHRIFLVENASEKSIGIFKEVYSRELTAVSTKLKVAPHNESAWEYLRGLLNSRVAPRDALAVDEEVKIVCYRALTLDSGNIHALSLLSDIYWAQAEMLSQNQHPCVWLANNKGENESKGENEGKKRKEAIEFAYNVSIDLLKRLRIVDPIRRHYYSAKLQNTVV